MENYRCWDVLLWKKLLFWIIWGFDFLTFCISEQFTGEAGRSEEHISAAHTIFPSFSSFLLFLGFFFFKYLPVSHTQHLYQRLSLYSCGQKASEVLDCTFLFPAEISRFLSARCCYFPVSQRDKNISSWKEGWRTRKEYFLLGNKCNKMSVSDCRLN